LAAIERARDLALQAPEEVIFLYEDEHTANLRPLIGRSERWHRPSRRKGHGSRFRADPARWSARCRQRPSAGASPGKLQCQGDVSLLLSH
jgi:hypothetical protein